MSFFSRKEAYLGVDIGAHGIKLVELCKTKGRPQLWTYGIADQEIDIGLLSKKEKTPEELLKSQNTYLDKKNSDNNKMSLLEDPRVDEYANLLKELCRRAKVTTKKVTASLPASSIFHAVLTLPKIDKKEINDVVMAEVAKMFSMPIDELQVVHQVIPDGEDGKYLRILVTAAPKSLVQFYSIIFKKAGLELQDLETEAFALERSLVGKDQTTAMVVDIGFERTSFFIVDKGLPLTHRSVAIGGNLISKIISNRLQVPIEMTEQVKKDLSFSKEHFDSEIFNPVIDPIIKEIKYSFDLFLHQSGNENKRPEKIILTGGSSVLPFFVEQIKKEFPLRVFVGDPWARVVYQDGLKFVLDQIGPRMSVSIGLAIRNILK